MRKKKVVRRVTRRRVKLWFGRNFDGEGDYGYYDVFETRPRVVGVDSGPFAARYLSSKTGSASPFDRGTIVELCESRVRKTLGLNLREGEMVEVTLTFGKVEKP